MSSYGLVRRRKITRARQAVARARAVLRRRSVAPLRTGGYYGPLVRRQLGELKTSDINNGSFLATTTGTMTLLNSLSSGSDYTQRIGRKVMFKSIFIRGFLYPEDTATSNGLARIIIFYDKQTNSTTPANTDLLVQSTSISHLNLDNRERFKVLVDKQFILPAFNTVQGLATTPKAVKIYKKVSLQTVYDDTTAGVGSISTGGIFMLTIGSNITGEGGIFSLSTRLRFSDQ